MRSPRTTRKIVGVVSAAAVSVLLVGGPAAATAGDLAGHGIRTAGKTYSAGHGVQRTISTGHGI